MSDEMIKKLKDYNQILVEEVKDALGKESAEEFSKQLEKHNQEVRNISMQWEKDPVDVLVEKWDEEEANASKNGSLRYNKGKPAMHLVPPSAIVAIAEVLEYGASKYSERNWEKGAEYSVPYASLMRHLMAWWDGEDKDPESLLPHTYHILMNAAMLVHYEQNNPDLDDRPRSKNGKKND